MFQNSDSILLATKSVYEYQSYHPTIGAYAKIANVTAAEYDLLIQNVPGTNLSFKYIELEEAEKAFKLYSENIKKTLETKSIIK